MPVPAITFYSVVVFLHVAAVVVAFGVLFAYPVLLDAARRGAVADLAWFHRALGLVARRVITPAGAVVLLAGLYLALDGPYDFGDPWIGTSLLILVVVLGMTGAYFTPRHRRLAELAAGGEAGPAYDATFRQVQRGVLLADALIVVALFLMVTKPGG
jgi:uncharacterized membrane protein